MDLPPGHPRVPRPEAALAPVVPAPVVPAPVVPAPKAPAPVSCCGCSH
jgi:hypothetical protein